jgi:ATP-dependent Clp protease ATP-binding subunit ClpA
MFERFTEGSRAVIVEAEDIAGELGSGYIGVGHVLYGCAEIRDETAGRPLRDCGITAASIRRRLPRSGQTSGGSLDLEALRAIGIDFEGVQSAVEATFGPGALAGAPDRRAPTHKARRHPFTTEAKRSLELGLRAAIELHQTRISPGHLLLGLLRLGDAFVLTTVEESGATLAQLSAAVFTRLSTAA